MQEPVQFRMSMRFCSALICTVFTSLFLMSACTSTEPARLQASMPAADEADVAIVGIVSSTDATAPLDLNRLSLDLAALVSARGGVTVLSQQAVRQIVGAAPHDEMLGFVARHATLAPYQTQRLMAADLSASYALFARVDADNIEFLPVITQDIVDKSGTVLADRERQIYTTRRTTQLSTTLLDMRDGQIIWTRQYRVAPETSSANSLSVGESLGASIAAAVANSVMQSEVRPRYPEPADLQSSILALLQEVAYDAPIN